MNYAKCINNQPYLHPPDQPPQEEPLLALTIGKVYKVLADPAAEKRGMLRVVDESYGESGSENGYLYPADYFEPFLPNGKRSLNAPVTIYLDEYTKGVLHAEAIAADTSTSALIRLWLEERLDLPAPG
jgi:hypothetical protein